jgi:hypothetical protein
MKKLLILIILAFFTSSCGGGFFKYSDAKKNPTNANDRIKKNVEEGRGFRLGSIGKKGGDFLFSSANPMWRATMEKLSFAPLSVVDYGGGIIITDWFSDESSDEEIKISVRFLTNEIRSDAIKIIIHKRKCENFNNCKVTSIENKTNQEIRITILRRAAELQSSDLAKSKEESGEYKIPGKNF